MAVVAPEPVSSNPLRRLAADLRAERSASVAFPPGDTTFSVQRAHRMIAEPLDLLLDAYERHGPVFTLRLMQTQHVFALGPEAHRSLLVSDSESFEVRDSYMRELIPLLGDGLLTVDGEFHRRSRSMMVPAFKRDRMDALQRLILEEAERSLSGWPRSGAVDVYSWARDLAMRIALRWLLGVDPDGRPSGVDAGREFERAQAFHGREIWLKFLRGPGTPFAKMVAARRRLDVLVYGEIALRRRTGARGDDVLSLLLDAQDESDFRLSDREIRDEAMTLLLAGHASTAATIAFLLFELALHPHWLRLVAAEIEALGRQPSAEETVSGALANLDLAIHETLRLYPPAWISPRRCVRDTTIAGVSVPAGAHVFYCALAAHRLPDVWEHPNAYRPERFEPANRDAIPRTAYVPFGGGSRICLGMRAAQLELRTIVARVLSEFEVRPVPGYRLQLALTPSLAPRGGLTILVARRQLSEAPKPLAPRAAEPAVGCPFHSGVATDDGSAHH